MTQKKKPMRKYVILTNPRTGINTVYVRCRRKGCLGRAHKENEKPYNAQWRPNIYCSTVCQRLDWLEFGKRSWRNIFRKRKE